MELYENDKHNLRKLWLNPVEKQRVQMCISQAIANGSDMLAKDVDSVLNQLDLILEEEEAEETKPDQAL